jgi:large subunit ribosomal protein L11
MPTIKLLVDGGEMKPGPAVGQQLGPLGINIGEVISKVNEATKEFKGMKVPAILDIDPKTKDIKIEVSSPPASELLKKEIGLEKGSGEQRKEKVANISIEQIIKVAKIKHPNMLSRDFKSTVKTIIGSCTSLGILVESKEPTETIQKVDNGEFDKEIESQSTETSPEKKAKLKTFFDNLKKKQEAAKKAEEEAEKAAEEEKAKAAEEEKPAEGEAPAEGAAPEGEKPPEPAAEEPKKE